MKRRFTADFGERFDELLTRLADEEETSKAEVIKRAVAYYSFLKEQATEGRKVSISDQQDRVLKDVAFP